MEVVAQGFGSGAAMQAQSPCAIALGYFDGVHVGHRAVIGAARQAAEENGLRLAVFTFTQGGGSLPNKGSRIYPAAIKHELLAAMGVETCYEPPFESFQPLTPEAFFYDMLVGAYNAKAVFCGEDFAFGAKRAGTAQALRALCAQNGLLFGQAPTAVWQGQPVSSSRIRQALQAGDIPAANAMLGQPFETEYPVQHGKHLGSTLGMPTINQTFPQGVQAPAYGVYITRTLVDGACWPSATGYGTRPTVDGSGPATCETFIPDFSGDLYGKRIRVQFYEKIADPHKFTGTGELAAAVQGWARQAVAYFAPGPEKTGGGC